MKSIEDISIITNNAYRIASAIDSGHYNNILYYEFHELVNPETIYNCYEGLESFSERSHEFDNIFLSQGFVDEEPAQIHIAVKISEKWFVAKNCGSNYYTGYGPQGILKMRKACFNQGVLGIKSEENFDDWLVQNFDQPDRESIENEENIELLEFDKIIKSIRYLAVDMQRRPKQFAGLTEETIRDTMLPPINMIFEGRGNAEAKNCKGKTDILIRTVDGLNEHIFELKVWNGLQGLDAGIQQLSSYLSWHNNNAGLIVFCYKTNFSEILEKVEEFISGKFELGRRDKFIPNEFIFKMPHSTDAYKKIDIRMIFINLKTNY